MTQWSPLNEVVRVRAASRIVVSAGVSAVADSDDSGLIPNSTIPAANATSACPSESRCAVASRPAVRSSTPTDVTFSFAGFAQRGGRTDHHSDGWGIAFFEGLGLRHFVDHQPAFQSPVAELIRRYPIRSRNVVAHIRKATQGAVALENCHPFVRELWGRYWVFAHNGDLQDFQPRLHANFRPVGTTDSERAFCWLMQEMWKSHAGVPSVEELTLTLRELTPWIARHGRFKVAPACEPRAIRRRYRPGTLVLETEFETEAGTVRVTVEKLSLELVVRGLDLEAEELHHADDTPPGEERQRDPGAGQDLSPAAVHGESGDRARGAGLRLDRPRRPARDAADLDHLRPRALGHGRLPQHRRIPRLVRAGPVRCSIGFGRTGRGACYRTLRLRGSRRG